MYLETERIILRDFVHTDLDDLQEIFGDAEVMAHTEPPYDRVKTESFLQQFCIERSPKGAFAAVLKETQKLIGYVLFKSVDEPEIFEIGWIFNIAICGGIGMMNWDGFSRHARRFPAGISRIFQGKATPHGVKRRPRFMSMLPQVAIKPIGETDMPLKFAKD